MAVNAGIKGSETKGILGFAPFSLKLSELSVMLYAE